MKWSKTIDRGPTERTWKGEGKKGRYFIIVEPGYHPKRVPQRPFGNTPVYLRVQSFGPVDEARDTRNMSSSQFSIKLWQKCLDDIDETGESGKGGMPARLLKDGDE